jgi:phospholipase/lecithinase/hemolysin
VTAVQAGGIRQLVIAMNATIVSEAAAAHAVVVDAFGLFDSLHANGYAVGGQTLTTNFLGGLFSLDGLHPSNTGYAVLANQFLSTINTAFRTHIPLANVAQIAACDPLVLGKQSAWCNGWF